MNEALIMGWGMTTAGSVASVPLAMGPMAAVPAAQSAYVNGMVAAGTPMGQQIYDAINGLWGQANQPSSFTEAAFSLWSQFGDWKTYNGF